MPKKITSVLFVSFMFTFLGDVGRIITNYSIRASFSLEGQNQRKYKDNQSKIFKKEFTVEDPMNSIARVCQRKAGRYRIQEEGKRCCEQGPRIYKIVALKQVMLDDSIFQKKTTKTN